MELSIIMFFVCMVWTNDTHLHYSTRAEIHTNFRNFFNAYENNNLQKTLENKNIIHQEVKQEQEIFDTMKEELQLARRKNFKKQIRNCNISAVFKRNIPSTVSLAASSVTPSMIPTDLEKRIETIFEKEKVLVPKTHHRLLYEKIRNEEENKDLRDQVNDLKNNYEKLNNNLNDTKKVLNKIGIISHYRVIIERFHWNFCSMNLIISAKAKKIKNLRDEFIPPNLIQDRENAKEENNEKKLQKAYDNIASFNRRYQMTVAVIKHSEDPYVAVFLTQLEKVLKHKLSAHKVGILVASFYSELSRIDHNDDLKDDIDWQDEEAIKTALRSWKFDGEILDLAIAFHRFNNEI